MFSALLILLILPFTDLSKSRGLQFKPLSKIAFFIFVGNFLVLMQLGAKHVEFPFIELGQISTFIYFSYFLIILPLFSLIENSMIELKSKSSEVYENISLKSLTSNVLSISKLFCILFIIIFNTINYNDLCDAPMP